MKKNTEHLLSELLTRYPKLKVCEKDICNTVEILVENYNNGNKILLCGNGGSSSDAEHVSGELLKGFLSKREMNTSLHPEFLKFGEDGKKLINNLQSGIKAISLGSFQSALTAYLNDADPDLVYAQLMYALGVKDDILWVLSTSGNSKNIYYAVLGAKALGLKTIGMTGESGGIIKEICDICIKVPETETFKVQELHLPVYHFLCAGLESELFIN